MRLAVSLFAFLIAAFPCLAQTTSVNAAPAPRCTDLNGNLEACPDPVPAIAVYQKKSDTAALPLRSVPYDIVHQQVHFWASPFKLRERDVDWVFPFALTTSALVIADPTIDRHIASHKSLVSASQTFGNASIAAIVGSAGGMYLWGKIRHNDYMSNTGFMAGEAGLNSFLVTTAFKEIAQRSRPMEVIPPGSRGFRQGGSSFPSEHSAAAWSVASVVAHQYPGTGTKIFTYGLAAAISASRITGRQHFSSDAFIGSALGWYIGRQVWESHQMPDMKQWGTFERAHEGQRNPESMGSAYVALDSWIYSAFDRLAALGYVQSAFLDMRPWTRMECVRLLEEAGTLISDNNTSSEAIQIYNALKSEFAQEVAEQTSGNNTAVVLDSIYTRFLSISGTPLRDGYHFGQTITNDYGRPYGEGLNVVTGASGFATAGPLFAYVQGEYQRSPSMPFIPSSSAPIVSQVDLGIPAIAYPTKLPAQSRFDLLEGYFGLKFGSTQFSFGRQALWWGPTESGGVLFSNNAQPITMLRITQPKPFKFPSIFGLLGAVRTDFFVGRLSGHQFLGVGGAATGTPGVLLNPQPYIHGEKISFKPTPNFEFSIARTTIFSGPGFPFTSRSFFKSLGSFSTSNAAGSDPGDRRSSFNFSYRVPKLRDRLLLYMDSFTDDQISPLAYPRNSAINPGIYVPQVPGCPKLDFRAEGLYTPFDHFPGFFYFNIRYLQGYTNNGQLLGNWIGRQGTGFQLWSNYHVSPRTMFGTSFRSVQVDRDFLRGGSIRDYNAHADVALGRNITLSTFLQFERWNFPLLATRTQQNVTASIQIDYHPHWRFK